MWYVGQLGCLEESNNKHGAYFFAPCAKDYIMSSDVLLLAQSFVDIIAWFLLPFATMLAVTWVVSLFRR